MNKHTNEKNKTGLILGCALFVFTIVLVVFTFYLKSHQGKVVHPIMDILLGFIPSLIAAIGYGVYKISLIGTGIVSLISLVFNLNKSTRHKVGIALTVISLLLYAGVWYAIISGVVDVEFELWRGASEMPQ